MSTFPLATALARTPGRRAVLSALVAAAASMGACANLGAQGGVPLRFGLDQWTTEDGLASQYIADLVESAEGYLWLIASGSLVRFDGSRFVSMNDGPDRGGLPGRPIGVEVAGDTLWHLGLPQRGGSVLTRRVGDSLEVVSSFAEANSHLTIGADRTLWTSHFPNVIALEGPRRGEIAPIRVNNVVGGFGGVSPHIWADGHGEVWALATDDRIMKVTPEGGEFVAEAVYPVLTTRPSTGDLLIPQRAGATTNILDLAGHLVARLPYRPDLLPRLVDRHGRLWATSPEEVLVYSDGGGVVSVPLPPGTRASHLFEDGFGSMWIGTATQGLLRIRELPTRVVGMSEGIGARQVMFIRPASEGSVLAVDRDGSAYRIRRDGVEILHSPAAPARGARRAHYASLAWEDSRGTIWLSVRDTEVGGTSLVGLREGEESIVLPTDQVVRVMIEDPRGDGSLWIAGGTLQRIRPYVDGAQVLDRWRVDAEYARSLAFDAEGALWTVTDLGLLRIRSRSLEIVADSTHGDLSAARAVLPDADGAIWIGTYGRGLLRYKDGEVRRITQEDGLAEDVASTLLFDGDGQLWMAGNRSIHRVALDDARDFLEGRNAAVTGVAYAGESGIPNPETSGWSGARDTEGNLWFPTFDGAVAIDPRRARALESSPPSVRVEGVRAEGSTEWRTRGPFHLAADQRRFEVAFTGIDLRDAESVTFRYRLTGFDPNWIESGGRRVATYTNVPAGAYQFEVEAVTRGGVRASASQVPTILVAPFFWETPLFMVVLAVLVIGGGLGAHRMRLRVVRAGAERLRVQVEERTADVTAERKRAEEALQVVAAQADDLRSLDESKSRFFSNVSHELRTPLTLILGPLKDLREGAFGGVSEPARRELDNALENGRRLAGLVDRLLEVSRLESDTLKLYPARTDIVEFIAREAGALASLGKARRLTVDLILPDEPIVATFDEARMAEVLGNLLRNAFKFSHPGGRVAVTARREDGPAGPGVLISVADEGIGIPSEAVARVFDRFYQVDDSSVRQHQGMGVGLALVKDLVELHGGWVAVESREGHGSRFDVWLPTNEATLAGPTATGVRGEPAMKERALGTSEDPEETTEPGAEVENDEAEHTVLVVEDNPGLRAYLRRHLETGYRVIEASDGVSGLAMARAAVPDLVISDVMMPEMDGEALVSAIRADDDLSFVPVILLTAKASHDSRMRGLKEGADDYLTKPFDTEELLLRTHNLIESRRRLRERLLAEPGPPPSLPAPRSARDASAARFLNRLHEVLREHLSDEDFDVDALASKLSTSRSALYRRMQDTLGVTPMEVIRGHRLDQAAQWLRETDVEVTRIAYGVGFKTVPHFSRRFRDRFGVSPSEYRKTD